MSSVEAYESCDELNRPEKGACQLVVSRGDSSELLEIVEETLDQVSFAVEHEIGVPWCDAICFWRNHGRDFPPVEVLDQSVGIVSLVRQKRFGVDFFQKNLGLSQIRCLSGRERNRDRITKGIGDHMDLGGQPTSGSADGLIPPFCAPALC